MAEERERARGRTEGNAEGRTEGKAEGRTEATVRVMEKGSQLEEGTELVRPCTRA